jgi:phosphoglycolate phosphatase
MAQKTTLIFDFDGTLANSLDLIVRLYNEHVSEFGYLPLEPSEFPSLRTAGYKKAMKVKKIKVRKLPKMIFVMGREMRQRIDEVRPFEGIVEVLAELKKTGYSIGVLTSNQAPLVNHFLMQHNFPEFDFVVSEKTLFGKDKAIKKILKIKNLAKNQVLYIGDEPRDVTASRKSGVGIIGVSWGFGGKEGFIKDKPDFIADEPSQLIEVVSKASQE